MGREASSKKTTRIIVSLNIKDSQIYTIKKVKLNQKPDWNRIYLTKIQELRETKSMLRLNHKNVLRLYNWWFEEERHLKDEEQQK